MISVHFQGSIQNQCVGAKAVLRGKSIAIKAYLIWKKSQVSNLILYLKKKKNNYKKKNKQGPKLEEGRK